MADILRVDSEDTYTPASWEATPITLNQWGPAPPENFFDYFTPATK